MSKHPEKFHEMNRTHVSTNNKTTVYQGFFSVEEHSLSYRKFNKDQSAVVTRSALISSDAVIVLPYDPLNDRVLLIEQFRTGPYVKGDEAPWVLEPIAGLIDADETPENAGIREAQEDEFIEFVNLGGTLDLSGYTVHDNAQERHVFPQGTIIPSGGVLVLFGGGNPTGAFGNAIVQTASAGILNMNNAGDFVTLYNTNGEVVLTFDIEPLSNNPNESYTRYPDLNLEPGDDGILFYQHAGIGEALGAFFSPGTKIDGTNFN